MTFLRKKTFLLFASSIAVLFFSFLITNSSLAQTSSCGDITNEFDCSIKNGIWDQNNSTCSDCITADTGGGGAAGNGGGGVKSGNCGGDPNLVWDNSAKMCFPKGEQCTEGSLACSKSLSDLIIKIINYLLIFAGMIAVLAVIVGGFWYITAAGNEEQAEKGKKAIINSIIGIVVITLAFLIIRVISHTLTSGSV
jgi:hypothetical protein